MPVATAEDMRDIARLIESIVIAHDDTKPPTIAIHCATVFCRGEEIGFIYHDDDLETWVLAIGTDD